MNVVLFSSLLGLEYVEFISSKRGKTPPNTEKMCPEYDKTTAFDDEDPVLKRGKVWSITLLPLLPGPL